MGMNPLVTVNPSPTLVHTRVTCAPLTSQLSTSWGGHHVVYLGEGSPVCLYRRIGSRFHDPLDRLRWIMSGLLMKWPWLCLGPVQELPIKPHTNPLAYLMDRTASNHCPTLSSAKGQMSLRSQSKVPLLSLFSIKSVLIVSAVELYKW